MKIPACCVLVLAMAILPAVAIRMDTSTASSMSANSEKEYPVSKVVTLLKDMLKQLEKEAEEDEDIYDKLGCWCKTNEAEKTDSITAAESHITDLSNQISELTATSARLSTEIENAEAEKAANQDSLDKATALREKELAEFNAEEKDMLESLAALKAAITVIGSHHSSLLQVSHRKLTGAVSSLQRSVQKHASLFANVLTHSQKRAFNAFIQEGDYFDAEPTFKQSYAPQSGEVFGILQQMKETFENNLSASQKDEMAAQKAFEELKAAKEAEIAGNTAVIDKKTMELATTNEKNAEAAEDLEDTKSSLTADEEFLLSLKEKCSMTDAEWEKRQKTRAQEMEAVSKAISVLNADASHALFSKTFNPEAAAMLLQEASLQNSHSRAEASKLLSAAAQKVNNPRLAALAVNVRLDAFVRVKKAIDEMIASLTKEKADEIEKKDFCISEFNENEKKTTAKDREKADLVSQHDDLEMATDKLTGDIAALKLEIETMQSELKAASTDREAQNKNIQVQIADSRATQKVLASALGVLEGFYKSEAAFIQRQEPAGPPPPPGFEKYEKNEGSGTVMKLLEEIIADAKDMEAEAAREEAEAQAAFEAFVKETKASIAAKQKSIVNKSEEKAKAEKDLVETKEGIEAANLALENLKMSEATLGEECNFLLKNFEVRQTSFDEEVEALKQAKAILSGAQF